MGTFTSDISWSIQAVNFQINFQGSTSAARVVALLDDRQLAQGDAPLGFLNPFLYKQGHTIALLQGSNPASRRLHVLTS
ncbi:hypothetical protein C8Q74DRAFT_1263576 [Fomes fomentarius]|nr:hypothetical protein C8Q74DRAFT_1263576 [Fomes fomentarius]